MNEVYITRVARFLPNKPVNNDHMEAHLGFVNGKASKARRIVLRNNRIQQRYYAVDKDGTVTHTNAELTKEAVNVLCGEGFELDDLELLSCGTGTPDQLLPAHASMVHGELTGKNIEVNTASGACCSGMSALKYGYMAVKSGQVSNAVCTGSERVSTWLRSAVFEEEAARLEKLSEQGILAFEKEFLRWMLSDGAGAFLLREKPGNGLSLKIEWMEAHSYAGMAGACMYAGAEKLENGQLRSWSEYPSDAWAGQSLFALKQDVRLLEKNILKKGVDSLKKTLEKHDTRPEGIDYFLPHISSYYFKERLYEEMRCGDIDIPEDRWYLNLDKVGNIGAASIYVALEGLFRSGRLKKGEKILLSVPESARFSYAYAFLTVC